MWQVPRLLGGGGGARGGCGAAAAVGRAPSQAEVVLQGMPSAFLCSTSCSVSYVRAQLPLALSVVTLTQLPACEMMSM